MTKIEQNETRYIFNPAFISGGTNNGVSDRETSSDLFNVIEKTDFEEFGKQNISADAAIWKVEAYESFLNKRLELVVEWPNQFLGHDIMSAIT